MKLPTSSQPLHRARTPRSTHTLHAACRRACRRALLPACQARLERDEEQQEFVREVITFVTSDGLTQIPGRRVLRPARENKRLVAPMPTWEEQSIVVGASFQVAATNGQDCTRRISIEGFCQSVDHLFDCVQDALERELDGEVLIKERQLKSGIHEVLKLTVAIPFLFGVPPQLDVLNDAIRTGGGFVDRVRHVWLIQAGL